MYLDNIFRKTPIYLRIFIYLAQKCELSVEIKMEIYIIENSWNFDSYKTVSQFTIEPQF